MKRIPGLALVLLACLAVLPGRAAAAAFDDFESYAVGSNLHGQGGWAGWAGNPNAGALVSTNFSFSPTRSVNITGASDLVRTFSGATNGQWVFRVMQFIPSTSTGTSAVILMNTYQAPYGTNDLNWSVQIQCNLTNAQIISDFGGGATLPMIKDQWVEFRCEIDLAANSVSEFYNGQLLTNHVWQGGVGGPGLNEIQALDLFANNAGPVYYDNVSLSTNGTCSGSWTQRSPLTPSPSARDHHAMAYDSVRGRTVLFGGRNAATAYLGDTWEWNGVNWIQAATTGPSARNESAMAYDTAHGVVVLFGGGQDNNPQSNNDTWLWNGTTWTHVFPAVSPSARIRHAMSYDSTRGVVVLFGGLDASGPGGLHVYKSDTWEWDGTTSIWTLKTPVHSPSARTSHAMSYDSVRQRTVLFGGSGSTGSNLGDTWEWDGTDWSQVATTGPTARFDHALAYDSGCCAQTILFGGYDANGTTGRTRDTWGWNGTVWSQVPASGPSARNGQKMTYDSGRGRLVLFGGYSLPAGVNGETWEFVQQCASNPPVVTCATNKTVECGTAWTFDPPTVSGGCGNVTTVILSTVTNLVDSCELMNTRTWLVTDSCSTNTCTQVVTIVNAPPTLFCPTEVTAYTCSNSVPVFFIVTATNTCTVSATNNCITCPKVLVSCFPPSGSLFGLGTNTVTCFATDFCGATNSCTFQVVVMLGAGCCQPPIITMQPATVATAPGGTAMFTSAATGSPTLVYQWLKDGVSLADGGNISGAHTPALTVSSAQAAQVGGYSVVVTNFCGVITSAVAQIVLSTDYLPDIGLVTHAQSAVIVSNNATFTFTISNEGALPLQNLTFTGTFTGVPATFIQASPGCVITPSGINFALNCPLPLLPVGTSVVYTVTFRVDQPGTLVFSGSINATPGEITLGNNSASASTRFGFPPFVVTNPVGFNSVPGGAGSLNVSVTGTAPLSYFWRLDNVPVGSISDTLSFPELHASDEGSYNVIVSNAWGTAVSGSAVVTLTFPGVVTAAIDGAQVLQVVGKTAATDLQIRLKAGDPTKVVVDDLGGGGVIGEFSISAFNKLVINLADNDNKLVFNDANGMVSALNKQFEIHGGTGSNIVVASSQGIDLNALPGLLTALAAAPDFETLTTNFYTQGYTNLMTPAIDTANKLYTNLVLTSQMLRDIANTNLLVTASNRVAQATLLGNLASDYANEAAWRFSGAGYSYDQFTNCLFGLIAELESIEELDEPDEAAMETISDQMDGLIENYEAGADQYDAALEASGDAYHARVQQNVQAPGDQLGNTDGPAFESMANAFSDLASQLLEAQAAQAELDADTLSTKALNYETAAADLVAQAAALNQTLANFTALADPLGAGLESIPTGTNAGCDKDISANNKFVINIGGFIVGTPFNDKITAKPKTLIILGLGGDDLIIGNDKFNFIHGGSGDDEIHGQGGTDLLFGGTGNDCIFGDEGFDLVYGGDGDDNLHGGTNIDLIIGGKGDDKMYGDENLDVMIGGDGNDTMEGGDGINFMFGGPGDDVMTGGNGFQLENNLPGLCKWIIGSLMIGGTGNDTMYGGDGIDVMFGLDGNDTMYSSNHIDIVFGNAGDDKIYGDDGGTLFYVVISGVKTGFRLGNLVFGGTGNDEITGGRDIDLLFGGDGNDTIKGSYTYPWWKIVNLTFDCGDVDIGVDDDLIVGGKGNDILDGGFGTDFIFGGEGDDTIKGNSEPFELPLSMSFLFGGPGNDVIEGGKWDLITLAFGNKDNDHISGSTFGVMNLLFGNDGTDTIEGNGDLLNLVFGGDGDDNVEGGALLLDLVFGGPGNDNMQGRPGLLDVMFGGDGDDTMAGNGSLIEVQFGNIGNDNMSSGPGLLYAMWGNDGCDTMLGGTLLGIMFGNDKGDTMTGGFGMDIMFGGDGPDQMNGGDGPDIMFGNTGNDTMSGGVGAWPDLILGNSGDDTIYGGGGVDVLLGNSGNDHIYGEDGPDLIFGGLGHDAIDGGDSVDLIFGGAEPDCLLGGNGNDLIFGGSEDDFIYGDADRDLIFGNRGSDEIFGGIDAGNYIFGNKGGDTIESRGSPDRVWGNGGNDGIRSFGNDSRLRGNRDDDLFDLQAGTDIRIFGGPGTDTYEKLWVSGSVKKAKSASEGTARVDMAAPKCSEVHGVTWLDLNQNGIRDNGETGVAGVVVYLDKNNNNIRDSGEPFTFSMADDPETCEDDTGMYWLTELPEGTYRVREVPPTGYHHVYPIPAHTVTLGRIDVVTNKDLGFAPGEQRPVITNVRLDSAATNFVLNGAGGIPDGTFDVLTSTNIATPLTNWTTVGTHVFDGIGSFSVTNTLLPGEPGRFFLLRLP